jgi:hypothetical protein
LIHILTINIVLIISWETHHPKLVVVGVVHLQKNKRVKQRRWRRQRNIGAGEQQRKQRRTEGRGNRSYQLPEPADGDLAGDGAEEVASDVDLAGESAEEVAAGVDLAVAGREEVVGPMRRCARRGFISGGRRG